MIDLHVSSEVDLKEAMERAKELELETIGYLTYFSDAEEFLRWIEQFKEEFNVIPGVVIKTENPDELTRLVNKIRDKALLIMVEGKSYSVHRAACDNPKVDVLCSPEKDRADSGFDHVCAKAAADNSVAIEISLRELLNSYRKRRVAILSKMRRNIMLCKKFNVPIVITSGATNLWEMRSGKELASIGNLLGLELEESIAAVETTPIAILERNRKRSGTEGVENA